MPRKKRASSKSEKKKRVHRKNKGPLWEVKDGKIVRTHRECPRCGAGYYMAQHYNRYSCGRCGYTKFDTPGKTSKAGGSAARKSVSGVATPKRTRKPINK